MNNDIVLYNIMLYLPYDDVLNFRNISKLTRNLSNLYSIKIIIRYIVNYTNCAKIGMYSDLYKKLLRKSLFFYFQKKNDMNVVVSKRTGNNLLIEMIRLHKVFNDYKTIQLLIQKSKRLNELKNNYEHDLLSCGVYSKSYNICKILLDKGLNPQHIDASYDTPIKKAIRLGLLKITWLLTRKESLKNRISYMFDCLLVKLS